MLVEVEVDVLTQDNLLEEQAGAAQAVWELVTQRLAEVLMELLILVAVVVAQAMALRMVALAVQAL
jgi:hypothetical protein